MRKLMLTLSVSSILIIASGCNGGSSTSRTPRSPRTPSGGAPVGPVDTPVFDPTPDPFAPPTPTAVPGDPPGNTIRVSKAELGISSTTTRRSESYGVELSLGTSIEANRSSTNYDVFVKGAP